ncbi:hypothetical protein C8J57DRAFT_1499238 [Mycena rebaudengoi]|nr:hypothetical protein C8J57DRAFT_1499238 [Mycena rebaudengoi]
MDFPPELYTKSRTKPDTDYYGNLTRGRLGPDGTTAVPLQTAPMVQHSSTPLIPHGATTPSTTSGPAMAATSTATAQAHPRARLRPHVTIGFLGLHVESSTDDERADWPRLVIQIFPVDGLYNQIVNSGEYHFTTNPMGQLFNNVLSGCGLFHIAAWICAHHITVGSSAVQQLELYTRSARNHNARTMNPENTMFSDWPTTALDFTNDQIIQWSALWFPPCAMA